MCVTFRYMSHNEVDIKGSIQSYFNVSETELETIYSYFKPASYKKGDFLLKKGRQCDRLCFINSGLVRVYTDYAEKEVTQWISTPGYFLTDLASFTFSTPARWNMQALTDCELFSIDRESYNALGNRIPNWHVLEKLFIAKCFVFLEERVFSHLSMTAEERYKKLYDYQPSLFNEVPLQYLASMLGMTPETLSRLRRKALQ